MKNYLHLIQTAKGIDIEVRSDAGEPILLRDKDIYVCSYVVESSFDVCEELSEAIADSCLHKGYSPERAVKYAQNRLKKHQLFTKFRRKAPYSPNKPRKVVSFHRPDKELVFGRL